MIYCNNLRKQLFLLLILSIVLILNPMRTFADDLSVLYDRGIQELNSGEYNEALKTFKNLGEFKDSAKLYLYTKGLKFLSENNLESAKIEFENLGSYKSSKMYLKYIRGRILEDSGLLTEATQIYYELGSFHDSKERISEIKTQLYSSLYSTAFQAEKNGFYELAIEGYLSIADFRDARERIEQCQGMILEAATSLFDSELYWQSWIKTRSINNYPDAQSLIKTLEDMIDNNEMDKLFPARRNGLYGFIDITGIFIIEPQWEKAYAFSEGLAVVIRGNLSGYINNLGKLYYDYKFDFASSFKNDCANVWFEKNGENRQGIINRVDGTLISFDMLNLMSLWQFSDERMRFLSSSFIGFLDTKADIIGKTTGKTLWEDALDFSEGMAAVKMDELWGYINKAGEVVLDFRWYDARSFSQGLAPVKLNENSNYHYIDITGNAVIEKEFDDAGHFSEGLAAVLINQKWGFIDKTGNIVIPPSFESVKPYSEGYACIKKENKWGYIDNNGKIVISPTWDVAYSFEGGLGKVYLGSLKKDGTPNEGKFGYINKEGLVVYMEND